MTMYQKEDKHMGEFKMGGRTKKGLEKQKKKKTKCAVRVLEGGQSKQMVSQRNHTNSKGSDQILGHISKIQT